MKNLLLISNSTNAGEEYLGHCIENIRYFLNNKIKTVLFIPYAGVSVSYDDYTKKVAEKYAKIDIKIESIHTKPNPIKAIEEAEAIAVGGGNTFHLLQEIQNNNLTNIIKKRVEQGMPYMGWSAGSNLTCPTIKTTNDMPITEPKSFDALNIIPFQINPHYLDANPEGHAGETREMRIEEFMIVNKDMYVAGLREGTMLQYTNNELKLIGNRPMRIFKYNQEPYEVSNNDTLSFLLGE